jgi:hypothetical protein
MKLKKAEQIRAYWNAVENDGLSTELLFCMVADHFHIDNGDVAEALYMTRTPEEIASTKTS